MRKVTHYRQHWGWMITPTKAQQQMALLLGKHDTSYVKKMFTEPDNANVDFSPKKIMEKIRNILVAEVEDSPIQITLQAVDALATTQKQSDKDLLSTRGEMEEFLSHFGGMIGKPKFSIGKQPGAFEGNVKKFDEMGLDDANAEDLDYFFTTFYRLRHEVKAELPIAAIIGYNEMETYKPLLINDIMAKKCIALHPYVNDNTGMVDIRYLPPELIRVIMGQRQDCKDAIVIGYEDTVTVQKFISMCGSEFNWERDMDDMLTAVNYLNKLSYTGIGENGRMMCGNGEGEVCTYNRFLSYRISFGYMEWKEVDGDTRKTTKKDYHGNPRMFRMGYKTELPENSPYSKDVYYNEVTYKSYYLVLASGVQRLYKFGKLNYQQREGTEDEYSNYSLCVYQGVGPSITEIAEPHIKKFEKAWAKREYLINKAKEPGYMLNLDAILEVATKMVATGNPKTDVMQMMEIYLKSPNMLYTTLNMGGQPVGGNGIPHHELKNGLAVETVQEFRKIMEECIADINDTIGISPIRDAYSPDPRDGLKLQMQSLNYSRNATQYINTMLSSVFNHCGVRVLSYCQDIIEFGDKATTPYKALLTLLGDQTVEDLEAMGKVPLHRYAIYMKPFSDKYEMEEVKAIAAKALEAGQILPEQLMLINSMTTAKEAALTLSYATRRTQRIKDATAANAQQGAVQLEQLKHQNQMQLEQLKGELLLRAKNDEGRWWYLTHIQGEDAETKRTALEQANKLDGIQASAEAQKGINEHSASLQGGEGEAATPQTAAPVAT